MKKINSVRLILLSGFLLSSSLLFTSCSKESLQEFKENKADTALQFRQQAAPQGQTTTSGRQIVIWKPICCWYKVGEGGSCSVNMPIQLTLSWQIVAGPKSTPLVGVGYRESNGYLIQYSSVTSGQGTNGVYGGNMQITAQPFVPYYLKLVCGNEVSWVPHMGIDENCYITFPATSVTVMVSAF